MRHWHHAATYSKVDPSVVTIHLQLITRGEVIADITRHARYSWRLLFPRTAEVKSFNSKIKAMKYAMENT